MLGRIEIKFNSYILYLHDSKSNDFVNTVLQFHTPVIELFNFQKDDWGEWYRELGLRAPTTLIWHKSDYFWSLNLSLFGFGISVGHQNGY
jgi:hypothetical protein